MAFVFLMITSYCDHGSHLILEADKPAIDTLDSVKVIVPFDRMIAILQGEILSENISMKFCQNDKFKLLRFINENECSICQIKSLYQWDEVMDLIGKDRLDLLLIIRPEKSLEVTTILSILQKNYFSYPVWIDTNSCFYEANTKLCQTIRETSILIDPTGNLCYIGNPLLSEAAIKKISLIVSDARKGPS